VVGSISSSKQNKDYSWRELVTWRFYTVSTFANAAEHPMDYVLYVTCYKKTFHLQKLFKNMFEARSHL